MKNKTASETASLFNTFFLQIMLLSKFSPIEDLEKSRRSQDEILVLQLIDRHRGGILAADISRFFGKNEHEITKIVTKLERERLVTRPSATSRDNGKPIYLTDAGTQVLISERAGFCPPILTRIIESMPKDEAWQLQKTLEDVTKRLDKVL